MHSNSASASPIEGFVARAPTPPPRSQELVPKREWTPSLDKLLRMWGQQCKTKEAGHMVYARSFQRRHYVFGTPATLLGTLTTGGILLTYQSCGNDSDSGSITDISSCENSQWVELIMAVLSGIGSGLTAFMTIMNYQVESEKHKLAADSFGALHRIIQTILIRPPEWREDPKETLEYIRSSYDELVKSSPVLDDEKYDVNLDYEVAPRGTVRVTPPAPGELPTPHAGRVQQNQIHQSLPEEIDPVQRQAELDNLKAVLEDPVPGSNSLSKVQIPFELELSDAMDLHHHSPTQSRMSSVVTSASQADKARQHSLIQGFGWEIKRLNRHADEAFSPSRERATSRKDSWRSPETPSRPPETPSRPPETPSRPYGLRSPTRSHKSLKGRGVDVGYFEPGSPSKPTLDIDEETPDFEISGELPGSGSSYGEYFSS